MSVVGLSMEGAQGIAAAMSTLSQSVEQLAARQAANTRATVAGARASTQAATGLQSMTQQAHQGVQRIQGVASAVQSLVGALGSHDRTAGLIASVAGTTSQFAAMGAALGPHGALVGGIAGLVAGIGGLIAQHDSARVAAAAHREELAALVTTAREARAAMGIDRAIAEGGASLATSGLSDTEIATETERRLARITEIGRVYNDGAITAAEQLDAIDRGMVALFTGEEVQTIPEVAAAYGRELATINAELANLDAETRRREADAIAAADMPPPTAAADPDAPTSTGRGGGRGVARAPRAERAANAIDALNAADAAAAAASLEEYEQSVERTIEIGERLVEARRAAAESIAEHETEIRDAAKASAEHHRELLDETGNAAKEFSTGYVSSIDEVISSWHELADASRASGTAMVSTGRLMERGVTAIANNIAESVGGTMTSAFSSAVGAWLDGSKSFVEAAEEMAKGVIKALVQESIVQGVTELARGIADLASYRYDSAALHFAAAGAWAIVGGVAGGIGAATGAFGGGGKDSGGSSQRDMADADRERQREAAAGPTVVNLYMTGMPMTQADVGAGFARGIRASQRAGYLPAGALTGGR